MKITFVGVGSQSSSKDYWQSNAVITSESGKNFLIDAGGDIRHSLAESGFTAKDIDSVYISHLHDDHCFGIPWLGFQTYFPKLKKPTIYIMDDLEEALWETVRAGMKTLEGKRNCKTETYFNKQVLKINGQFIWENIQFVPVQVVHYMDGNGIVPSFGLLIKELVDNSPQIFYTSDTQHNPNQIKCFYAMADLIFHDCETDFPSGVHAHYSELINLPEEVKAKIWLYHYNNNHPQDPVSDGFRGFVQKGQIFEL